MLVVSAFGWGLFVHDPAPSSPERPTFLSAPGEPLPAPAENKSYRLTVRMESSDPETGDVVVRKKKYVPGKQAEVKDSLVASGGEVVQYVTYRSGSLEYTRRTYDDSQTLQQHVNPDDVARVERASLTSYQFDPAISPAADIEPREALQKLYMFSYEFRGTTTYNGHEVKRYVPVSGWTTRVLPESGTTQSLYVREASGEVLVDADDGAIRKATVEGAVVEADSWGEVMTGDATTVTLSYRVRTGVDDVSRPPWVEALKNRTYSG